MIVIFVDGKLLEYSLMFFVWIVMGRGVGYCNFFFKYDVFCCFDDYDIVYVSLDGIVLVGVIEE